jgi:CMP-N,N'-diacetyllegionaminic acid synthase
MIEDKKILALIPARGGSKGLPGKNIRKLCGKPLIAWPIDLAKASRYIDSTIVSTDAADIAEVARSHGADVIMRPAELASDTAIVADVIRHVLSVLDGSQERYDYIVLLEATSPMRTLAMIDECIEKLARAGTDSVATFQLADPPPSRLWKIEGDSVKPFMEGADPWLPRQQQVQAHRLNGMVYGFDVAAFRASKANTLFVGTVAAVVTDTVCVDIDTLEDFELADMLLRNRYENLG